MKLKAVLCDLDGTLVDTAPEIADAVNDTLLELKLPTLSQSRITSWVGRGAQDLLISVLSHVLAVARSDAETWPHFDAAMRVFRRHYEHRTGTRCVVFDGVRTSVEAFRRAGVALAIVTNKDTVFARKSLEANGILDCFEVMVCGDSHASRKPDPTGTLAVLDQLKCDRDEAIFVGDSAVDVETARRAGLRVLAFSRGYNGGEPIASANPDAVFDHWNRVTELAGLSPGSAPKV